MDNILIGFLQELEEYNAELKRRVDTNGVERVYEDITAYTRELAEKDPDRLHGFDFMLIDIKKSKQKIAKQNEEIRAYADLYDVSNDEYNQIMAGDDVQRREEHLRRLLEERIDGIQGTLLHGGSIDKQVHRLNTPDEMLVMRKNIYIDEKNIAEALSLVLFESIDIRRMMLLFLDEKSDVPGSPDIASKPDDPLDVVFQKSLKEMLRVCLLIEGYQHKGLLAMRHLEELDRQIVFMLVSLALGKHRR